MSKLSQSTQTGIKPNQTDVAIAAAFWYPKAEFPKLMVHGPTVVHKRI
jgi:hypothetical protein